MFKVRDLIQGNIHLFFFLEKKKDQCTFSMIYHASRFYTFYKETVAFFKRTHKKEFFFFMRRKLYMFFYFIFYFPELIYVYIRHKSFFLMQKRIF